MHDGSWSWSQSTPGQTPTTYSLRWNYSTLLQETRNFLSISNYEFIRQMDYALQSDREIPTGYRLYDKREHKTYYERN